MRDMLGTYVLKPLLILRYHEFSYWSSSWGLLHTEFSDILLIGASRKMSSQLVIVVAAAAMSADVMM